MKFTYSWIVRFIKLLLDLFFPHDPPEEDLEEKEEEKKGGEEEWRRISKVEKHK